MHACLAFQHIYGSPIRLVIIPTSLHDKATDPATPLFVTRTPLFSTRTPLFVTRTPLFVTRTPLLILGHPRRNKSIFIASSYLTVSSALLLLSSLTIINVAVVM